MSAPIKSIYLRRDLERGEIDLALLKRDANEKGGIAVWPERVHWVTSKSHPGAFESRLGAADRLSLRLHLPGARDPCAGERGPRLAHVLYQLQPRRHSGRGRRRTGPQHSFGDRDPGGSSRATAKDGFSLIDRTEVALVAAPGASPATLGLADRLAEFCTNVQAKAA